MISSELTEIGTISIDPRKVWVFSRAATKFREDFSIAEKAPTRALLDQGLFQVEST